MKPCSASACARVRVCECVCAHPLVHACLLQIRRHPAHPTRASQAACAGNTSEPAIELHEPHFALDTVGAAPGAAPPHAYTLEWAVYVSDGLESGSPARDPVGTWRRRK